MEINRLIEIVQQMAALQQEFNATVMTLLGENPFPLQPTKIDEKLMDRLEVQQYLGIKESTYKRKVKEGKLKPMRLPGGHKYNKSSLLAEHKESLRRGRI